jgi:hypothetical protein
MFKHACSCVFVIVAFMPAVVAAHRLDEYLQATRVAIQLDRVVVDIDLTPGVNVAPLVTSWIDANGDGELSRDEAVRYAVQVLSSVALSVDGRAAALTLMDIQAPAVRDIYEGTGTLRLQAFARMPATRAGRHQVTIVNSHHPESSVYLANALVPLDDAVHIAAQVRDREQHRLTIDYEVQTAMGRGRVPWLVGAALLLAGAVVGRLGLGRSTRRRLAAI